MEIGLRKALLEWLIGDADVSTWVNSISEEVPAHTSLPWIAVGASGSHDWSHKTGIGREIRVALEMHCRGDRPDAAADLVAAVERRVMSLPVNQNGFSVVVKQFLRGRVEQRGEAVRAFLLEFRFRVLAV